MRTIFTGIPKAGCTNWLMFLLRAEGALNRTLSTTDLERIHTDFSKPFRLSKLNETQRDVLESSRNDIFSFVVVRNPWTRMVSGYRDKLSDEQRSEVNPMPKVAYSIAAEFNGIDNITDSSPVHRNYPTFNQYLRWLAENSVKPGHDTNRVNPHFNTQWRSMCINSGSYDYIIPLEYSNYFIDDVEQRINTSEKVMGSYDKSSDPRKQTSTLRAKEWLSQQDPKLIEKLFSIFEADFALMNYSNFSHPDFPLPLNNS
jgi:hypothetical protein